MIYKYSYINQTDKMEGGGHSAALCLHACYSEGQALQLDLPEQLDGHSFQALAAYAFSAANSYAPVNTALFFAADSLDRPLLRAALRNTAESAPLFDVPEAAVDESLLPPRVAGDRLQALRLPTCLTRIGRYAFYNCTELSALALSSCTDLGSGLFTGCDAVRELDVFVDEIRRSCLQELLLAFHNALLLRYWIPAAGTKAVGTETDRSVLPGERVFKEADTPAHADTSENAALFLKYRLIFPQYYENADENTPARITVRDLHGSGLFYRNCFADSQFQIERYDQPFAHAEANEPEDVTTALAFCRLLVPTGLSDEAADRYRAYLHAHPAALARHILSGFQSGSYEAAALRAVLAPPFLNEALINALIDELTGMRQTPAALLSLFMDIKKQKFSKAQRARRFELL